ncbi:helix-turn-helix domain-containing protein [Solimonas sp. K1W22B-7]|uniref:helix-turn-helix domain-containing protein n=1 Tax=Solimonas sp. K1W22B-7 TaxID=2303331 RepID=UPI000E330E7B|nr:helix-turn-helix domain-containing protein [Solimonas sp. K1W22B-7]AXQ28331.1 helix-turn-helix domain-containing protein [Solimonas sp. K1W22B-7]
MNISATGFSREFKLAAVQRMLQGENVTALASELGIRRKHLYLWRDRFRAGGADALRGRGRPPRAVSALKPQAVSGKPDVLAAAQQRIADLERKIGRQQVELDFFQQALRHIEGARRPSAAPGAKASIRSSKR